MLAVPATTEDEVRNAQIQAVLEKRAPGPAAYQLSVLNDVCQELQEIVGIIEEAEPDDKQVVPTSDGSEPVTIYGLSPKLAQRLIAKQQALINLLIGHAEAHTLNVGIDREDRQFQMIERMVRYHNLQAWFVKLS